MVEDEFINDCWENGTLIRFPKGGWWTGPIPKPK